MKSAYGYCFRDGKVTFFYGDDIWLPECFIGFRAESFFRNWELYFLWICFSWGDNSINGFDFVYLLVETPFFEIYERKKPFSVIDLYRWYYRNDRESGYGRIRKF